MQKYYNENLINRTNAIIEILKINSPEKYQDLENTLMYCRPELYALKLTEWVNNNVPINPESAESLAIYSLLTTRTINDIKRQMQSDMQQKNNISKQHK